MIPDLLIHALFGLAAGLLIGCAGIGGVILVPLLSYGGGVDIHTAIAGAMFAYLISGAMGTIVYARHGSIRWDLTRSMWLGAMPAAFAGALAASVLSTTLLELCIGLLTALSGFHALIRRTEQDRADEQPLSRLVLASAGAVTGFLSALTGTGGPLVLIPILLWLRLPVLTAIGLGQAIQLPIAALATGGNVYAGTLDLVMGIAIGAGISIGTWVGGKLAHRLPKATLRTMVSVLLILVGGLILLRLGHTLTT
ncbi:MAG: sulfite exporter TauE/SafE family protein [Geminicoccaceae bacterium]